MCNEDLAHSSFLASRSLFNMDITDVVIFTPSITFSSLGRLVPSKFQGNQSYF